MNRRERTSRMAASKGTRRQAASTSAGVAPASAAAAARLASISTVQGRPCACAAGRSWGSAAALWAAESIRPAHGLARGTCAALPGVMHIVSADSRRGMHAWPCQRLVYTGQYLEIRLRPATRPRRMWPQRCASQRKCSAQRAPRPARTCRRSKAGLAPSSHSTNVSLFSCRRAHAHAYILELLLLFDKRTGRRPTLPAHLDQRPVKVADEQRPRRLLRRGGRRAGRSSRAERTDWQAAGSGGAACRRAPSSASLLAGLRL